MRDIEQYLNDLKSRLDLPADRIEEILAEVRLHLESETQRMMAGLDEAEATRLAIQRFGRPAKMARRLCAIHRPPRPYFFRTAAGLVLAWWGGIVALMLAWPLARHLGHGLDVTMCVAFVAPVGFIAGRIAGRWGWLLASSPFLFWAVVAALGGWSHMGLGEVSFSLTQVLLLSLIAACMALFALAGQLVSSGRLLGRMLLSMAAVLTAVEVVAFFARLGLYLTRNAEARLAVTDPLARLAVAAAVIVLGAWLLDYLRLHRDVPADDDMPRQAMA